MLKILIGLMLIAFVAYVLTLIFHAVFSPEKRADRKEVKRDAEALRNERIRSTLAQNALREIAAGGELPVFVASDALSEINKTYTKEIA